MSPSKISDILGFVDGCTNHTLDCNKAIPPCRIPDGMDFSSLWNITKNYYHKCGPDGAWLSNSTKDLASAVLSSDAAYELVGGGYTEFPKADMWSRLTTWKFPLIQLLATLPRPPLGILVEVLAVLHMVSDPIGSIEDLLYKLECCQNRAVYWRHQIRLRNQESNTKAAEEAQEEAKAIERHLTIIADSYSELDAEIGADAVRSLRSKLNGDTRQLTKEENDLLKECTITAGALAADRATTFVPVFVAEVVFVLVFVIDIVRMQANPNARLSSTSHNNIEVHSLGFSSLFLWLMPAILIAAIIGTSQTENAIPRILTRFQRDLVNAGVHIRLPELDNKASRPDQKRWSSKQTWLNDERWLFGLYSWQPLAPVLPWHRSRAVQEKRRTEIHLCEKAIAWQQLRRSFLRLWPTLYTILPGLIVCFAILTGILISVFVPPWGWRCRTNGELYFGVFWVGSYLVTKAITGLFKQRWVSPGLAFLLMLLKDLLVTAWAIGWVFVTQIGWYNRPKCYMGDHTGLILPEQPNAYAELQRGLRAGGSYVTILSLGLFAQAASLGVIYAAYATAIRTLMQKDDNMNGPAGTDSLDAVDSLSKLQGEHRTIEGTDTKPTSPPKIDLPVTHVTETEMDLLVPRNTNSPC